MLLKERVKKYMCLVHPKVFKFIKKGGGAEKLEYTLVYPI